MPSSDSPRQPIRSTRDEPHVPSPDWYEYADVVDPKPVGDLDDDLVEALEATARRNRHPRHPYRLPLPVSEQSVAPVRPEPRRASRWFEDAAGDGDEKAGSDPAPAVSPVKFPWEQTPAQTSVAPERPVAPTRREEPQPPARAARRARGHQRHRGRPRRPPHGTRRPAPRHRSRPLAKRLSSRAAEQYVDRSRHRRHRSGPRRSLRPSERTPTDHRIRRCRSAKSRTRPRPTGTTTPMVLAANDGGTGRAGRGTAGLGPDRLRRRTPVGCVPPGHRQPRPRCRRATERPSDGTCRRRVARPPRVRPGWYRDPSGSGDRRFWDGSQWTNGTDSAGNELIACSARRPRG